MNNNNKRNNFYRKGARPQGGSNRGGNGGGGNPRNDAERAKKAQNSRDKYLAMAKEAAYAGDRVLAENYYQHADHFNRVLSSIREANPQQHRQQQNNAAEPEELNPQVPAAAAVAAPNGNVADGNIAPSEF